MIDKFLSSFSNFWEILSDSTLKNYRDSWQKKTRAAMCDANNGNLAAWLGAYCNLPVISASVIELDRAAVKVGTRSDCDEKIRDQLKEILLQLHPWRKGPFDIFGIHIDTEWRSDLKWERLQNHISPLGDRCVLDIGCGSGYHCWRMRGQGARLVVGIDPTLLFAVQFWTIQKYVRDFHVGVLPIGVDDLPENLSWFDTVFSMGLLYHRRSPLEHLLRLRSFLRPGGELVLETLVIDGDPGEVLAPAGRYAQMPNVWFIPSVETLQYWLERMQFEQVRCVDVSTTTSEEQRSTDWMRFQSLSEFLDPRDPTRTVEGYPAPKRAIFVARVAESV